MYIFIKEWNLSNFSLFYSLLKFEIFIFSLSIINFLFNMLRKTVNRIQKKRWYIGLYNVFLAYKKKEKYRERGKKKERESKRERERKKS